MNLLQKQISTLFCILLSCTSFAKMVEFKEDISAKQAPKKIVQVAEKAAALIGLEKNYEVIEPKKMAIDLVPLNKFIRYFVNPSTKNPLIIVNTEWFSQLPESQQTFLLGRSFLLAQASPTHFSTKIFILLASLFRILILLFVTWLLGKTILAGKKRWIRFLISLGILIAINIAFLNRLELQLKNKLDIRFAMQINEKIVQKTGDREAAIKALETLQRGVAQELKNDETFWTPYKTVFQDYADALKQKEN